MLAVWGIQFRLDHNASKAIGLVSYGDFPSEVVLLWSHGGNFSFKSTVMVAISV